MGRRVERRATTLKLRTTAPSNQANSGIEPPSAIIETCAAMLLLQKGNTANASTNCKADFNFIEYNFIEDGAESRATKYTGV